MHPSRLLPQFHLRLSSHELKDWLSHQAKVNKRTLGAEINFHLERAMALSEQSNASLNIQPNGAQDHPST